MFHPAKRRAPSVWSRIEISPALPEELQVTMGPAVKFLCSVEPNYFANASLSPNSFGEGALAQTWGAGDGLVCFSGGPAAVAMRDVGRSSRELFVIEELGQRYPGIDQHFKRGRFIDWPSAAYTGAGYSLFCPGEVGRTLPTFQAALFERLHFAGEHASPGFSGYMEGALDAGVSVARRIAMRDRVLVN